MFFVAFASLLPVVILSAWLLVMNARDQETRLYRGAEDTVLALMNAVDAELKSSIAALDALAVSQRLARGAYDRLREEALRLLERRTSWLNIVIADGERQLMNVRLPEDAPLPDLVSPETSARVIETGRPVITGVMWAPAIEQPTYAVQIPYESPRGQRLVITAVIRPDALIDLLDLKVMADRGVVAILDGGHRIIARSRRQDSLVGQFPSEELRHLLDTGRHTGRGITRSMEGDLVHTVFRRSDYSGWFVAMGLPENVIGASQRRAYLVLGGAIVLSILLGLGLALLVGRAIVRPMRELEQQALLTGSGQAPTMPRTRLPEVRRIAVALAAAHDAQQTAFRREHDARLAAEKASKAKDEFLAMLGHELRNPLSAITNAAQVIDRQRGSLDPAAASAATIIGRQTKHLARLTDDLLDAGRVILGKISLTRRPVDLADCVRTVVDELRGTRRLGGHELSVELEPVAVHGDPTRIDQIVMNLLTNALKYTPDGGRIRIATRRDGAWAVLEVSDSGIGLEPGLLPRVFDLFVQGERALDRAQGGLGIGLTLVRRLAELHGGDANAQSDGPGKGATFAVRLPAIDVVASPEPEPRSVPAVSGLTVALVEDNDDARASLRMLLEVEGHRVVEAADGKAGAELIERDPRIDIAFIDIGLPGISGYAVAEAVRAGRGRAVRLVAMSGYGAEQDVQRGEQAGFDAYLVKPAEFDRVQQELAMVSGERKTGT